MHSAKNIFILFAVIATVCQVCWGVKRAEPDGPPIIDHGELSGNESASNESLTKKLVYRVDSFNRGIDRPNRPNYHNNDDHGSPSNHQLIPGTNLKTRTFYKLRLRRFPYGYVTYTAKKNFAQGYRYIQIDNNRDNVHEYDDRNGEWRQDAQWEFVPVSSDDRYRWYKLRNRARPREYATWSLNEFVTEDSQSSYLILDPNYPGKRSRTEFLFRPVLVKGYRENGRDDNREYYQLKLRDNREGVITWSRDKEYATECYYVQVDNNHDERHMRRYEKGNDRFADTLFSIQLAEKEDIDDHEVIEDNHYHDDNFNDGNNFNNRPRPH